MRRFVPMLLSLACIVALLIPSAAQPPAGKGAKDAGQQKTTDFSNSSIVIKMMEFNTKKDGKLTKEEVTDPRLHRLFDLADTNKDGVVTKEELMALAAKMEADWGQGNFGGKGPGGPGGKGPGGPGGKGPGGPGGPGGKGPGGLGGKGPGGFGGPPQPGQIMPVFIQDQLKLSADQKKQLEDLQKDVDGKLGKILTEDQQKQLKEIQDRGPGGKGFGGKGPGQ
jgi:hypothetical protein